MTSEALRQDVEVALAAFEEQCQLAQLHQRERGAHFGRLEFQPISSKIQRLSYSSPSTSEKKRLSPLREPKSCTSDRRPHRRNIRHRSAISSSSTNTMPP
jgi:hypothetical protein